MGGCRSTAQRAASHPICGWPLLTRCSSKATDPLSLVGQLQPRLAERDVELGQGFVDVGVGVRGADEPVVVGVDKNAVGHGGGAEGLHAGERRVVGHPHEGHGGRAAGDERRSVFFAQREEAGHEALAGEREFFGNVLTGDDVEGRERGGHGRGVVPVTARKKHAAGGGFVRGAADAGGDRVSVGEGFAVNRQVGRVSVGRMRAVGGQAEAAANVV